MNSPRWKMMMKLFLFYIVVLNMVITTAAVTTNNRILLSNVLVGTALAASVCKYIADDIRFLYFFLSFSLPSVRRISQWNLFVICFFFWKKCTKYILQFNTQLIPHFTILFSWTIYPTDIVLILYLYVCCIQLEVTTSVTLILPC